MSQTLLAENSRPSSNLDRFYGSSPSTANRQYYLDWVRVGTILLVFFFHCGRFFDYGDWHVKNAAYSPAIDLFTYALVGWMMPMFFFISGASTWFALGAKSNKQFISDRSKRILIPLLMGILLLSPHQVYLERLTHHQFSGSFIDFIPRYFSGWYAFGGTLPGWGCICGIYCCCMFFPCSLCLYFVGLNAGHLLVAVWGFT